MGAPCVTAVALGLAAALPDIPRWIETRALLQSPHATVSGTTRAGGFVVRVVHGAVSAVSVVGCPPADAIVSALHGITSMTPLVAQVDNAHYVERVLLEGAGLSEPYGWRGERVIVHQLGVAADAPPPAPLGTIRLLTMADDLAHLPPGLRHEMTHAREIAPVGALFAGNLPVSFCYPCWRTESLWDVSIDTLAEYRGRGFALHVVRFMISQLGCEGLAPVWATLESNAASLRLAQRLGFRPVDENVVFSRGAWAFLSGGFDQ
jgi:GNAT superfamily N-acetyltransferase